MKDVLEAILIAFAFVIVVLAAIAAWFVIVALITLVIAWVSYPLLALAAPTVFGLGGLSFWGLWAILWVAGLMISLFNQRVWGDK